MAKLLRERVDFGKVPLVLEVPYLVEFQKRSFERFLQKDETPEQRTDEGLHSAFNSVFPITDYNDTASIEFISYTLSDSKADTPRVYPQRPDLCGAAADKGETEHMGEG